MKDLKTVIIIIFHILPRYFCNKNSFILSLFNSLIHLKMVI